MIDIARETLVFRRGEISSPLSLLIPTFAFLEAPPAVIRWLLRRKNAPLPILFNAIPRLRYLSYTRLLSTPGLSTSELLRTL